MPKLALMQQNVADFDYYMGTGLLLNEFDMIVMPINPSGIYMESFEQEFIYPDLVFSSRYWNEKVVTMISNNISCDSMDLETRKRSEKILRNELNYANHLQSDGIKMLRINGKGNFNLARIVSDDLIGYLLVEVPLCNPYSVYALHRSDFTVETHKQYQEDTWQWWNEFHAATDYNPKIKVVLTFNEYQYPKQETIRRWLGEPVDAVIIPVSLFDVKDHEPSLSKMWLELLQHFIRIEANIILSISENVECLYNYTNYLRVTSELLLRDHCHRGFEDILCLPQQPLKDNLSTEIYEKYEEDELKYKLYQDAITAALIDRVPNALKKCVKITIMILGAGRGPLVRSTLNAAKKTGRKVFIYVIEKNINAIRTLRHIKDKLWTEKAIKIVHKDIREYCPPEKADILVSEMLGSFGDNELSPEVLKSAERFLKSSGISIPCQYTSFIHPIMSTAIYNQIRALECNKIGPYERGSLYSETAYVGMLQNVFNIGFPQPLFTFTHPNNDESNERYMILKFKVSMDCVLNGIAGCFEAILYKDIKISIHPETHTIGLISWFGMYFPIKTPMPLKKDEILEIHFWRCVSATKVWYEWQIVSPQITHIHNRGGHSYPIYAQ